jgi:chromosome segregation ATPase
MTSEIKTYIEQIAAKSRQLHQLLVAERERSASMLQEVSRLNEVVEQQEQTIFSLQNELTTVQTKLTEQREQVQEIPSSTKEFEIDGLVREIDFCIQQLKIANG